MCASAGLGAGQAPVLFVLVTARPPDFLLFTFALGSGVPGVQFKCTLCLESCAVSKLRDVLLCLKARRGGWGGRRKPLTPHTQGGSRVWGPPASV